MKQWDKMEKNNNNDNKNIEVKISWGRLPVPWQSREESPRGN